MRNAERWAPSKYVPHRGRWRGSRDRAALGVGSRLNADGVVACYEAALPAFARGALLDLGCGSVPLHGLYAPHVASSLPSGTHQTGRPCGEPAAGHSRRHEELRR